MKVEIYNILSEYCADKFFQTGETPAKEEMQAALQFFIERFYNGDVEED